MNIFWFRRDLRCEDNAGLFAALKSGAPVLPIFIFDDTILDSLNKEDARVSFIHSLLTDIQNDLQKNGRSLAVFKGKPTEIFRKLCTENAVHTVYTNRDYEPYAIKRDLEVKVLLSEFGVRFESYKDQVIFEQNEVVKEDGTPYQVFTPYAKKWKSIFNVKGTFSFDSENYLKSIMAHSYTFLSLEDIGFKPSVQKVQDYVLTDELIEGYETNRNFPALDRTTYLSPHLRFGSVSVRKLVLHLMKFKENSLLNELIWREFFMQILWHYPESLSLCFHKKYENIKWLNDENNFKVWKEGMTGYPIVDAGMRQLNATGYMHNRVRMIVASFLCKHLLIDWRWGEAYFAEKLLDYEMSSNVGNWQWAAGTGVDAAPYFRVFNPSEQAKKFDKEGRYIRTWVPEIDTFSYPRPIVEHSFARNRCLEHYKRYINLG